VLLCAVTGLIGTGLWVTGQQRERSERAALAARLSWVKPLHRLFHSAGGLLYQVGREHTLNLAGP
jgi:hypothetical protein